MKKVEKAANMAITRLVKNHNLPYKEAESAVMEILKENVHELQKGQFQDVINCLNML